MSWFWNCNWEKLYHFSKCHYRISLYIRDEGNVCIGNDTLIGAEVYYWEI